MWKKLQNTYEQHSAATKIYWLRKFFNLKMKEGTSIDAHLNEFNSIVTQLANQKYVVDEETKGMALLISLPESWDTFTTAMTNANTFISFTDITGLILQEEQKLKAQAAIKPNNALNARGRSQQRGKSQERGRGRSKSRSNKDVECYYCGKKGHTKKQCFKLKNDKRDKAKDSDVADAKAIVPVSKGKSSVKIEEIHSTHGDDSDGEVLFLSSLDAHALHAGSFADMHSWIIDSGASFHVTPYRDLFVKYTRGSNGVVFLGDNHACNIVGFGDVKLVFANGTQLMLHNVRHVPEVKKNLISTGMLDDEGYVTSFGHGFWKVTKGALVVARGPKVDTIYTLHAKLCNHTDIHATEMPKISMWHNRLGHMSITGMEQLACLGYLPSLKFSDLKFCEHCIYGRQLQCPHKRRLGHKDAQLELVHTDVCEMPSLSLGGTWYFVTFIDDSTRKVWLYPLQQKSDVFPMFQKWLALVENQTGRTLKALRSDNGGEYLSNAFNAFCDARGIKRELPAPYSPPQNGTAERMNRTIQEKVRSMMSHAALSYGFWAEAVKTSVHLINRSPNKRLDGRVPEELWTGKTPSYKHLRVFGCTAYVHIRREERNKLDPKSLKCIFLGYGDNGGITAYGIL